MEHHASYLAQFLTWLLHLERHPWGDFAHGMPLSILERFDHLFAAVVAMLVVMVLPEIAVTNNSNSKREPRNVWTVSRPRRERLCEPCSSNSDRDPTRQSEPGRGETEVRRD